MPDSKSPAIRFTWEYLPPTSPSSWGHSIWILIDNGQRTRWTLTDVFEMRRWWYDGTAIIDDRHREIISGALSLENAQAMMIDSYLRYKTPADVTPPASSSNAQFAPEELPIDRPTVIPETQCDDASRIVGDHSIAPSIR